MRLLRSSHAYCGNEPPTSCTWRARALLQVPKVVMLFSSSLVLSVVIKSIRPCGVPALTRVSVRARHAQCVEKQCAHAVPYTVYYIRYVLRPTITYALIKGYALIIKGAPINPSLRYMLRTCDLWTPSFIIHSNIFVGICMSLYRQKPFFVLSPLSQN